MKTQTTFRKKALLGSTAMMLVALLALGTATYAWFTASTQATASGINMATSKVSNLQISKTGHTWTDTVAYGFSNLVMKPVSTSDGNSWFIATAASGNAFDANTTGFRAQTTPDDFWFADQLNIKNNGTAAVQNVKVSINVEAATAQQQDYIRVALVPATEAGANNGTFSVFDNSGTAYAAAKAAGAVSTETTTTITPTAFTTDYTVTGQIAAGAAQYFNLYVWFEGQDAQCYNVTAGATISNIKFTVNGDTVEA